MTEQQVDLELLNTAHHEAAHAVVAHVLGMEPTTVTIAPDEERGLAGQAGDRAGSIRDELDHPLGDDMVHIANAMILMAGKYGSLRVDKDCDHAAFESDRREAAFTLDDISHSQEALDGILTYCEHEAKRLVDKHWPCIERVAQTLLKEKTIDGSRVEQDIKAVNDPDGKFDDLRKRLEQRKRLEVHAYCNLEAEEMAELKTVLAEMQTEDPDLWDWQTFLNANLRLGIRQRLEDHRERREDQECDN